MTYPDNVPALLTISDFARRCGISRATAAKIADSHPEHIEQVDGGQKYVKASLLFSYYGDAGQLVELDDNAIAIASAT